MGTVTIQVIPGAKVVIEVNGATNVKDAFAKANLAFAGNEVRVNGASADEETPVRAGDYVLAAARPEGAQN